MSRQAFSIFDEMLEGVQVIDKEFRYVYVNDAVVDQSTKSRKDLIGRTMQECYPGIEDKPLFLRIRECFATRKSQDWINKFDFPNGTNALFQLRIIPLHEAVLILSFDVTSQKKAEALIENTKNYLEEIVKTRTEELSEQNVIINGQLQQLKDINKTKDRFFSIVAHDLMAPLRSSMGLTSLLATGVHKFSPEELLKAANQLHESVQGTLILAEDLIAWASLQMQSSNTANLEQVGVEAVIAEVYSLYKGLAERKGVTVNYYADTKLRVAADRNQLSFVVRNLVNNAIKYTNPGGTVSIIAGNHDENRIYISVEDEGVGIPEHVIENIRRLEVDRSTDGTMGERGTGLGLMLCHEFVGLNNGEIRVASVEGKGSTMKVLLHAWNDDGQSVAK